MQAHGKGKLVPTGKSEPTLDVSYGISHPVSDENDIGISSLQKKKAVVHFILCDNGRPVLSYYPDVSAKNNYLPDRMFGWALLCQNFIVIFDGLPVPHRLVEHPHLTERAIPWVPFRQRRSGRGSLQGLPPSTSMSGNQQTAANPSFRRNEA